MIPLNQRSAARAACLCAVLLAMLWINNGLNAQVLQGPWVDASERAIDQHRKTDVTVIVLDREDRAVHGAAVRLVQQRHAFVIGLTLPGERLPDEGVADMPVYRVFNAVALDRLTDWSSPSGSGAVPPDRVAAQWCRALSPARVSFGRVVSADPARNTDKLSLLGPADLRDAVLARIKQAVEAEPHADRFDLYADLLNQDLIERKLGLGMPPRMFELARARRPDATLAVRVRDAVTLQRGRELTQAIQRLEVRQLPFDAVSIEQRFTGQVQPLPLGRMLDEHIAVLPVPTTLVGLEVGGPSEVAAGISMETVLRQVFAQPTIEGIYLAGVLTDEVLEPNAALLAHDNQPTAVGAVFDALFHEYWHSDVTTTTDERGNADARVFAGWYTVTATLPDGETISSEVYLPRQGRTKRVVLQATLAEQG